MRILTHSFRRYSHSQFTCLSFYSQCLSMLSAVYRGIKDLKCMSERVNTEGLIYMGNHTTS